MKTAKREKSRRGRNGKVLSPAGDLSRGDTVGGRGGDLQEDVRFSKWEERRGKERGGEKTAIRPLVTVGKRAALTPRVLKGLGKVEGGGGRG